MAFYEIDKLPAKTLTRDVEIRVVPGEHMTMVFFYLQGGGAIPEHSHPHEQIGTVLAGAVELDIGGEKKRVGAGHAYRVAPDIPHSGRCVEGPATIVEVFSPRRDDYQDH